jgi:hypothetical protein
MRPRVKPLFRSMAAAAGALLAVVLVQPGPACADTVATNNDQLGYGGLTYAQVQARTSARLMIGAKVGSERALEDCTVTGSRNGGFLDNSGQNAGRVIVLSLYCAAKLAGPGKPGNSVQEPEGQAVKALNDRAASLSNNFAKATEAGQTPACGRNDGVFQNCVRICELSGKCSKELTDFLGL